MVSCPTRTKNLEWYLLLNAPLVIFVLVRKRNDVLGVFFQTRIYSLFGKFTHVKLTEPGLNFFGNCHGKTGAGTQ